VSAAVLRLAAFLTAALLLAGCAALRMAYDNADSFVRWRASSYLDLQGEAAGDLDERIDAFHAWHRAQELPAYAKLASEAAKRIEDGVSPADIVWGYDSFMVRAKESLREAAERVAPVLDRLTPEQVKQVEKGFADDNRKFARENMRGSEKDRRNLRFKRTRERLEDWVGRLSDEQLERVRRYADASPLFDELRDRDRKRLQAQILEMVRAREAQKRLRETAENYEKGRDPAYAAASEAFRKEYFAMLLDVDKMLSTEQRARAVSRLRGFAEDFAALSVQRGEPAPRSVRPQ
jgi:hypothetical protein